jgi:excisionase family DNA binding protein
MSISPDPGGERAVFVRIPSEEAERLDRAAFDLKVPKRELIAGLVSRHLDHIRVLYEAEGPTGSDPTGLTPPESRFLVELPEQGMAVGRHDFRPAPPSEVLTLEEVAELLQANPPDVRRLAERGDLPGRKLGRAWRFSRAGVLAWLAGADQPADS